MTETIPLMTRAPPIGLGITVPLALQKPVYFSFQQGGPGMALQIETQIVIFAQGYEDSSGIATDSAVNCELVGG